MGLRRELRHPRSIGIANTSVAPVITLTTDFGLSDHYVAAVKGAILSVNPGATVVDVSHDVLPQGIEHGAFLLGCAFPYFPAGSIHVAVVDPGVGTERLPLALVTADGIFIGPDNGILSAALADTCRKAAAGGALPIRLPTGAKAFVLSEARFHRSSPSDTFHARDIFGPAAGHVSLGVSPSDLGQETNDIVVLPPFRATTRAGGALAGRIIHVDRFGNVITTVRADQLPPSALRIEIGGRVIERLTRTYAEAGGLTALIGSSGFLEVAFSNGSAARELGVQSGDPVIVRPA